MYNNLDVLYLLVLLLYILLGLIVIYKNTQNNKREKYAQQLLESKRIELELEKLENERKKGQRYDY